MPRDHEDLICWQLADKLRQMVIAHTPKPALPPGGISGSRRISATQSRRRAGTSRRDSTNIVTPRCARTTTPPRVHWVKRRIASGTDASGVLHARRHTRDVWALPPRDERKSEIPEIPATNRPGV